jgi:hypothetical protein
MNKTNTNEAALSIDRVLEVLTNPNLTKSEIEVALSARPDLPEFRVAAYIDWEFCRLPFPHSEMFTHFRALLDPIIRGACRRLKTYGSTEFKLFSASANENEGESTTVYLICTSPGVPPQVPRLGRYSRKTFRDAVGKALSRELQMFGPHHALNDWLQFKHLRTVDVTRNMERLQGDDSELVEGIFQMEDEVLPDLIRECGEMKEWSEIVNPEAPLSASSSGPVDVAQPGVAVGQIWTDADPAITGIRTITVESIDQGHAVCRSSTNNHKVRIQLDRFRPVKKGYILVQEANVPVGSIGKENS